MVVTCVRLCYICSVHAPSQHTLRWVSGKKSMTVPKMNSYTYFAGHHGSREKCVLCCFITNRYVYRDKARHPRAHSARGGVVYLAYVPYLGMIYVICVTEECNYVLGRQRARTRPALRCLSAAFCALPRLHDCSKLWLDAFR